MRRNLLAILCITWVFLITNALGQDTTWVPSVRRADYPRCINCPEIIKAIKSGWHGENSLTNYYLLYIYYDGVISKFDKLAIHDESLDSVFLKFYRQFKFRMPKSLIRKSEGMTLVFPLELNSYQMYENVNLVYQDRIPTFPLLSNPLFDSLKVKFKQFCQEQSLSKAKLSVLLTFNEIGKLDTVQMYQWSDHRLANRLFPHLKMLETVSSSWVDNHSLQKTRGHYILNLNFPEWPVTEAPVDYLDEMRRWSKSNKFRPFMNHTSFARFENGKLVNINFVDITDEKINQKIAEAARKIDQWNLLGNFRIEHIYSYGELRVYMHALGPPIK